MYLNQSFCNFRDTGTWPKQGLLFLSPLPIAVELKDIALLSYL